MYNTPNGIVKNPDSKYVKDINGVQPDEPIDYYLLKDLIFSGVKFSYKSYDHKAAIEDMRNAYPNNSLIRMANVPVPHAIQDKHIVWRIGKLRAIAFNPDGKMVRFKIGNKFYKSFGLSDFGVNVKPVISMFEDKYDLINKGLAVEEII